MSFFSNFLHHLSFSQEFDFKPFDLCYLGHFSGGRVEKVFFRIQAKPVSFGYDFYDLPVQSTVHGSIKIEWGEVTLCRNLNIDGNFVNHDNKISGSNFSSFRKGLFRGLIDNPKLDHNHLGLWPK